MAKEHDPDYGDYEFPIVGKQWTTQPERITVYPAGTDIAALKARDPMKLVDEATYARLIDEVITDDEDRKRLAQEALTEEDWTVLNELIFPDEPDPDPDLGI